MNQEKKRLLEDKKKKKHWRRFGPYLAERQWGTVREDYSSDGNAWDYFTYDVAKSRAYRWGEDGIGGISDNHGRLNFAFSFFNGNDSHIKERLFGLSNSQGNHGEDIKEEFFHLDNLPTHSYMLYLYKYPIKAFPYEELIQENQKRGQNEPEFELYDTGVLDEGNYFDLFIEYAKITPDDLAIRLTCVNRSLKAAPLHVIPTIWYRNTWSFKENISRPIIREGGDDRAFIDHSTLGRYMFYFEPSGKLLFSENETGKKEEINLFFTEKKPLTAKEGTKAASAYSIELEPGEERIFYFRLSDQLDLKNPLHNLKKIFNKRKKEADDFYQALQPKQLSTDGQSLQRLAFAGLLWSKQFYYYVVEDWLKGDPLKPPPPEGHCKIRNFDWLHLYNDDVLSVPDKWEYPAFFSWDTAFHTIPLSLVDPEFAKKQLMLLTREWYMHPSGQLPAYEWNFDDVNPPVHAWACYRVYKVEEKMQGKGDLLFLESVYQKLLMNFTWWVNRKDADGKNVFQGGFLGLDNISVFNRSEHLPKESALYQSDATSWMGMYCLNMLTIALELAKYNASYEDMASKFYEHFLYIADAINDPSHSSDSLWDEEDGFYYDLLISKEGEKQPLKVRSLVGLMPLLAVATLKPEVLERARGFKKRMDWFIEHRHDLCSKTACMKTKGVDSRRILSLVNQEKLTRILKYLLDENEFLSPYGIRSISKYHQDHPYVLKLNDHDHRVDYEPAESTLKLFGGNSNWRGPIWFPINFLIIEALQKYHHYFGEGLRVECPANSGNFLNLWEVAAFIEKRLLSIFQEDESGKRPVFGKNSLYQTDPHFQSYVHFHEYFHGDTGSGLGASHQTGWTGLIAKLIQQLGEHSND
ncbi:MAG: glucosidase [Simkaniaceae bacterium]